MKIGGGGCRKRGEKVRGVLEESRWEGSGGSVAVEGYAMLEVKETNWRYFQDIGECRQEFS